MLGHWRPLEPSYNVRQNTWTVVLEPSRISHPLCIGNASDLREHVITGFDNIILRWSVISNQCPRILGTYQVLQYLELFETPSVAICFSWESHPVEEGDVHIRLNTRKACLVCEMYWLWGEVRWPGTREWLNKLENLNGESIDEISSRLNSQISTPPSPNFLPLAKKPTERDRY